MVKPKYRIDTELDLNDGETIYHVEKRVWFLWIPIAQTKRGVLAEMLLEILEELHK
jgi:hypothetical protein